MSDYCIGFSWGSRIESAAEVAKRCRAFLRALAAVDSRYGRWNWFGGGGLECKARVSKSTPSARWITLIEQGVLYTSVWRQPLPGYYLSFTVGGLFTVTLSCGGSRNRCLLYPNPAERMPRSDVIRHVMTASIRVWDPDQGSYEHIQTGERLGGPPYKWGDIGWMTYFTDTYAAVKNIPKAFTAEALGRGTLLTMNMQPYAMDDKRQLQALRQLKRALKLAAAESAK